MSTSSTIEAKQNKKLRLIGVEPITFGTETRHSIQLSYKRRKTIIRKEKKIEKKIVIGLLHQKQYPEFL